LREGAPIGVMVLTRPIVRPFDSSHIALVTTFADQAVIAIENVRLFDEVQARTRDLTESLRQQTATADVLKVISRSAFDLRPVLDTLVESAARLCDADRALIFKGDSAVYRVAAGYNTPREFEEYSKENPIVPGRGTITGRAILEGKTVHIPDVLADPEYTGTGYQTRGEYRSSLAVPLLREGETIGVFTLMRLAVRPYTEKQIELVTTFADQAVIAIENVRLFEEVQARTNELAQSVGELRALGEVTQAVNSTVDLETVLMTIVAKATQLSSTEAGAIYVFDDADQEFRLRATYGMDERIIAEIRDRHMHIGETAIGKAAEQRMPVQIADLQNDPLSPVLDVIVRAGFRALLVVPLLGPDRIVGALVVRRKQPGEFPKSTVELLQTFAAQSVLAIQNARLFENVEARTRELAKSLEELRTAQDRLVQTEKLASLGQLTAGIAHEIKNPLNFVNNFSAISVELIDELREALAGANLNDKLRAQISEIADMLQGNLDKVVQHGKRADSIVKNMLLHSRQGSQEHRPVDINAIVEESLNLAYHGARAEKQGFNITLERSLDPTAGEIDVSPQEITRVLINLISNGFYAATKRKAEANGGNYEPTLAASTKNLGNSVEIRIRDNGTGIPPEVKAKLFSPFFTTKPAGEGTGLGLSISHDVIVKQHGGSIEVDTQPGEFTEFRIVLPRGAATIAKSGERA
jgi:GAF domain-containing protein